MTTSIYTLLMSAIYIFNVAQGKYLSIDEQGNASLSSSPKAIELSKMEDGTGRFLDINKQKEWVIKTADPTEGTYTIGCQMADAYATGFLYADSGNSSNGVATTYAEPHAGFSAGVWLISSEEQPQEITLDENATTYTTPAISASYTNITLTRKFANQKWNSICLPFALTQEQVEATWGPGTQVAEYTQYQGQSLKFATRQGIEAGEPCLLKPMQTTADNKYLIKGIAQEAWYTADEPKTIQREGQLSYVGRYANELYAPYHSYVFGGDNKMHYVVSDKVTMKGFRAYFIDKSPSASAKALVWNLSDTPTAIEGAPTATGPAASVPSDIYSLDGKVAKKKTTDTKGLKPGMYILNGMKVIVK